MSSKFRKIAWACALMSMTALLSLAAHAEPAPDAVELTELWERIDGSTATQPLTNAIYAHFTATEAPAEAPAIVHHKTYEAYERLFAKEEWAKEEPVDLIFVTAPYDEELAQIGEDYELVPVVRDALVFLNNQQNPITGLSSEQLRQIYAGGITDWSTLGGQPGQIRAYQRPMESGSQTLFQNLLMREREPMEAPGEWYIGDMGGLVDAVAAYNNADYALGYNMYYYVANMYSDWRVRMLAVDGVAPTNESIASDRYPLGTAYYAVYPKALPDDHPARRLVAWLLTDAGQQVAQAAGYVPLRPLPASSAIEDTPEATVPAGLGTAPQGSRWDEPLVVDVWPVMYQTRNEAGEVELEAIEEYDEYSWWPLLAVFPEAPALEDEINDWLSKTRLELREKHEVEETEIREGVDLWSNLLTVSLAVENEYYDALDRQCAVFDLKSGRRLQLCDLFYEGFDYLGYLNACLATLSLGAPDKYGMYHSQVDPTYPFDGISPQTNFGIESWNKRLYLALEEDARFSGVSWYDVPYRVNDPVPLWHGISPFGACKVELQFEGPSVPLEDHYILVPRVVSIDDGLRPEVEAAINGEIARAAAMMGEPALQAIINDEIADAVDRMRSSADLVTIDEKGSIMPEVNQSGRFLTIRYDLSVGSYETPIWGQTYDLHTGKPLLQAEQLREALASPNAKYWRKGFDQYRWFDIGEGLFPEGSTLRSVELGTWDEGGCLVLRVARPEGDVLRVKVPMEEFGLPDPKDFD